MTLWVVRHARAVPRSVHGRDARRPLTPRGRKEFAAVVRALRTRRVRFDRILHSPLLRAIDTAEMLVPLLRGETVVCAGLARSPTPDLLCEFGGGSVAVVGHEPWLSELVAMAVTGRADDAERFPLRKGGVVRLEGDPAPGAMALVGAWSPGDLAP